MNNESDLEMTDQLDLFSLETQTSQEEYVAALPHIQTRPVGDVMGVPALSLDIPFTITELSYLTHNFYRYYGKYPSVLGGYLVDKYATNDVVFDNYLGCGTTLVEAIIRGKKASGVDVNPLAVLACNVKTRRYDERIISEYLASILSDAKADNGQIRDAVPNWKALSKWFSEGAVAKLCSLAQAILLRPLGVNRDYAVLCFLSIVRRCSNAYDGEVRPHVNPSKKPRDVFDAFADKAKDMAKRSRQLASIVRLNDQAKAFCASNTEDNLTRYMPFGQPSLVVSHPPYLNCFNYYAVFSLENQWSHCFPEARMGVEERWILDSEHKCWPATDETIMKSYFASLASTYTSLRKSINPGSTLAVVIGDATMNKELIPVHKHLIEMLPGCGYQPIEVLYRTTHYGIGKYAYRSRADYHGGAEKKDGVVVARAV
jgi:hypothetical protein